MNDLLVGSFLLPTSWFSDCLNLHGHTLYHRKMVTGYNAVVWLINCNISQGDSGRCVFLSDNENFLLSRPADGTQKVSINRDVHYVA
ncbi:hypothetical protein F5Y01DRAFT_269881 [Xylaria sp. FL0043]|nr:hypothetical protein F5Y01DRAFT_269881 [Xylaria sp. FL0043]